METILSSSDATPPKSSVSLILPAKDEQECLWQAISEANEALTSITDDYEIIVVDDGSDDATCDIAMDAAERFPSVRVVRHETNLGYGAAIRSGFAAATKELIAFTDADCQFDLHELDRLVFLARDYDVVCGYRIDRKDTWLRCTYSKVYNVLVRTLLGTGLRDVDCALKLFRKRAIEKVEISTNGFLVNSELITTARQNDLSIVEVGVSHRPRTDGSSTVSAAHIPAVLTSLLRFWWTRVMFTTDTIATKSPTPGATRSSKTNWKRVGTGLLLGCLAILILFGNLGSPLIDRDETRYAEIPREMLATGNWMIPQLNFKPYYDKPPLFYWLCAGSYKLFGVSEWSARVVPAAAALSVLLATYCFGRRIVGERAAVLAASSLLFTIGFAFCGRFLIIDMVMTLFVALSLFTAYEAIRSQRFRWRWWIAASVFCALGVLTKGPLAGVLLLPPVLAFAWLCGISDRIKIRHWFALAFISMCIVGPWAARATMQDSHFLYEFVVQHNLNRFAGAYHQEPFWFFIPVLLVGGHPWSFLLVPYTSFFFSRKNGMRSRRPLGLGFLALWAAWCVFFFSLSKCKLPAYILPAAPAFALLIGHYLDQVLFHDSRERVFRLAKSLSPWLAATTTCIVIVTLSATVFNLRLSNATQSTLVAAVFAMLLFGSVAAWRRHAPTRIAWGACAAFSMLLVVLVTQTWIPAYARQQRILVPSSAIMTDLQESQPPMATYANEWSGIPFYLDRNDIPNFKRERIDELANFVDLNPNAIVIFDAPRDWDRVKKRLGTETTLRRIDSRGEASIVAVQRADAALRTASRGTNRH